MKKIVVGISGGVDSSVAAYLLKRDGYEVIGCRMRTFDTHQSLEEEKSAQAIAEKLGIPLIIEDFREEFRREVIDLFAREYMQGRTPNPCLICNRKVKWQALMKCMKETGAQYVATGHYAELEMAAAGPCGISDRIGNTGEEKKEGVRYAVKAVDDRKDQSYALYNLTQEELACTIFPLSTIGKDEVRELARQAGLLTADRQDSMEICFIPDKDYASFLKIQYGCQDQPGNFVDPSGKILGTHEGIIHYTIGQRKGLGIALGKKVFVKEIRPEKREVVLADDSEVYTDRLTFTGINYQKAENADGLYAPKIKIRYGDQGCGGMIKALPDHDGNGERLWQICFDHPVRAAAPGQAAVCYDGGGAILCGGMILA